MSVRGIHVSVVRVDVSIKMNESDWPMCLAHHTEQWKGDRVVAAKRYEGQILSGERAG